MANTKYTPIATANLTDKKRIVISNCSSGGYTLAQQLDIMENGSTNRVFLKGAIHTNDVTGLETLRDVLNVAIQNINENEQSWD